MSQILTLWLILGSICMGVPYAYYLYMKRAGSRAWRLKTNKLYTPSTTILIPVHNEEKVIGLKLENVHDLLYPPEKIQIITIDDCSKDNTLGEIHEFLNAHPEANVKILTRTKRRGKIDALNYGLQHATGEIVIVSDADCFWPRNIMDKALPYFADPSVGAVIGREVLLNAEQTWVTRLEATYADSISVVRVGESKIHSTILSQGGFGAYRRAILDEFDGTTGSDDSGTTLNVVQRQARTILVPEVTFFTTFPPSWKGKVKIKLRRANQLIRIWAKCLRLIVRNRLRLPKRIALPQIFLYILNPLFFAALLLVTFLFLSSFPAALILFVPILAIKQTRRHLLEIVLDNLILLCALFSWMVGKKFMVWKTVQESRRYIDRQLLCEKNLIQDRACIDLISGLSD